MSENFEDLFPGASVELPEQTPAAEPDPVLQRIDALSRVVESSMVDRQQESAQIRAFMEAAQRPKDEAPKPQNIPVEWDKEADPENPVAAVPIDQIARVAREQAESLLNERVAPYEATLKQTQADQDLSKALGVIRQVAPDLITDTTNQRRLAEQAMEYAQSPYNPGTNAKERGEWAIQRLREVAPALTQRQELPFSTGSASMSTVPAYNAVGRPTGAASNLPPQALQFAQANGIPPESLPPIGAKLKLPAKSIDEMGGMTEYANYNRTRYALNDFNKQHKLWTIDMGD